MKITKESKYAHSLDRCEVESVVNPLKDKEPTPAWKSDFKKVLTHYGVSSALLSRLAVERGSSNVLGHKYSKYTLNNMINNFIMRKGATSWTKNAQAVVNDHLDILIDYLSKPEDVKDCPSSAFLSYLTDYACAKAQTEEEPVPSLRERLEKLREERGGIFDPETNTYHMRIEDKPKTFNEEREEMGLKPIEDVVPEYSPRKAIKVKVRKVQKHKASKTIHIIINI